MFGLISKLTGSYHYTVGICYHFTILLVLWISNLNLTFKVPVFKTDYSRLHYELVLG